MLKPKFKTITTISRILTHIYYQPNKIKNKIISHKFRHQQQHALSEKWKVQGLNSKM